MDTERLLDQLTVDGQLLLAAAATAPSGDRVEGLEWTVREVVVHTGAVHRWAADIVRRALPTNETGGSSAFHPDDTGSFDLLTWFRDGHAALLATLREAPDNLDAFTFVRGVPAKAFWIRRQAHETAIHRVDVETAAGSVTAFAADFAQDGIDELVTFARNRAFACDVDTTLALRASDGPSWSIDFGGERITAEVSDVPCDTTVSGTSSELYRWLWNRPSPAVVTGADRPVELWRRVTIT